MKDWVKLSQRLVMIGQFGLSLLMPLLLCLGGCYLMTSRLGVGLWVYFPGFVLGLGGSFMTAYKLWLSVCAREKKKGESEPPAFNSHS
ncbi:MAG TPA: ATPase F0F1 [Lachnospiraceae bacterium]|nr:ATPase F0F1 [Lachnospiraceae bacterium]